MAPSSRSQGKSKLDLTSARTELLRRDAEWAAVSSKGRDIERILSYWTDDAIVLPPGLPAISGKQALREYVESSWKVPGFRITWTSTDVTFSPDGNLAYMLGRGITIWRRDPDGEMRCVVDIWNAENPT